MRHPRGQLRNLLTAALFLALALSPRLSGSYASADTPSTILMPYIASVSAPVWMGPDGGSIIGLAVDPTDRGPSPDQRTIYAGTRHSGVYKSVTGGRTWKLSSTGLGNLWVDTLTVDPVVGATLYAGTHGNGVFKSTNGGASWFAVNNGIAEKSVVYSVVVNPGNHNLVYAATRIEDTMYEGVLYKSSNGGSSWERVLEYDDDWVYSIAVNPSSPNIVLVAVHTRGPRISYDYGRAGSWSSTTPPLLDEYLIGRWAKGRAVAFDPRGWMDRAYYTAWHDGMISYSADGGESWSLSGGSLGASHVYPNGISVKPDDPDTVYLAAHESNVAGILRSADAGESFHAAGLSGKTIYSVAALGGGGDTILAGTYLDGVHRSANGGSSWSYYSMSGLHDSRVTGLVFANGAVYGSTTSGGGVFQSLNGGMTWKRFATGLGDNFINGLVQHPTQPSVIFALTRSAGLKRIDVAASTTWTTAGAPPRTEASLEEETQGPLAPPPPPDEGFIPDLLQEGEIPAEETFQDAPPAEAPVETPDHFILRRNGMQAAGTNAEVTALAFAPSSPSIAYFGTYGDGLYSSGNGGSSWAYAGQPGGVIRALSVSPANARTIYAATNKAGTLRLSTNGGADWRDLPLPASTLSAYSLAILPDDPASLFVGTTKGVYRYRAGAWTQVGLSGLAVYRLGFHPAVPSILFAGTNRGAHSSTLSTLPAWTSVAPEISGEEVVSINFDPADRRCIYLGSDGRGTLKVFLP